MRAVSLTPYSKGTVRCARTAHARADTRLAAHSSCGGVRGALSVLGMRAAALAPRRAPEAAPARAAVAPRRQRRRCDARLAAAAHATPGATVSAAQAVQDAADAGELLAAAALLPQPGREVRRRATLLFLLAHF